MLTARMAPFSRRLRTTAKERNAVECQASCLATRRQAPSPPEEPKQGVAYLLLFLCRHGARMVPSASVRARVEDILGSVFFELQAANVFKPLQLGFNRTDLVRRGDIKSPVKRRALLT